MPWLEAELGIEAVGAGRAVSIDLESGPLDAVSSIGGEGMDDHRGGDAAPAMIGMRRDEVHPRVLCAEGHIVGGVTPSEEEADDVAVRCRHRSR